ncbi:ribosomal protein L13 [Planoprotostelium fungivorum]|uniref:Ribosomal protein L13 n=1 Tax=Planoprotostelium fungivorum TaxID=1890364 RepID=A0A2P6NBN0_9EUKA|nr:ribosomal protein L13 [Planoprotostelium fungivorum]
MPKRNDKIPKNHFKKKWELRVKTWFDQPAQKAVRKQKRVAKAAAAFPRPTESLRPVVHSPTRRYNFKIKLGRGFTQEELKAAGVTARKALTIGLAVDRRRTNKSEAAFNANVQRIKGYLAKLVVFPHTKKEKQAGNKEELSKLTQQTGTLQPIRQERLLLSSVAKADVNSKVSAVDVLRRSISDAKLVGLRARVKAEKAAAAAATAKKDA